MSSTAVLETKRAQSPKRSKYLLLKCKGQSADTHTLVSDNIVGFYFAGHNTRPIITAHSFDNTANNLAVPLYLAINATPVNKSTSTFKL